MDLFERRDPELVEFVSHPVGKYGADDPGGLLQLVVQHEFKDFLDNFIIRRFEAALIPRPFDGYTAIKEASYLFLCLLSRPSLVSVRNVVEQTIGENEDRLAFFREKYLPFCEKFLFEAINGHFDFRNADTIMSYVVAEMRFVWVQMDTPMIDISITRWKTISAIKNQHVDRPDSEKRKEKNRKNADRTARWQEYSDRKYRGDPNFNEFTNFDCTKTMAEESEKDSAQLSYLYSLYSDPTEVAEKQAQTTKRSDTARALSILSDLETPSTQTLASTTMEDDNASSSQPTDWLEI